MSEYRHYSFDLWLTLIKSNPSFKEERAYHFHKRYNKANKSLEEVILIFRSVDLLCNAINEKTGGNISAEEMYLMVLSQINNHTFSFDDIDITSLLAEMDDLLFENMPNVYCKATKSVLAELKSQDDVTLSILSNTGFIKGKALRKVLKHLQLSSFFDFQLYSDEHGMSKPNKTFFELLMHNVRTLKGFEMNSDYVIHIGDNPIADLEGAKSIGIRSFLINSNNTCISNILN